MGWWIGIIDATMATIDKTATSRPDRNGPHRADDELREIVLHGHRVFFRSSGSGPVLVLVHGITSTSATWAKVLPYLAEHYTVIAPDLIGHGESAKPRGDYRWVPTRAGFAISSWRWVTSGPPTSGTRSAAGLPCSSRTSSPSTASAWSW